MGKVHWARHAKKGDPIRREDLGDNLQLVVRVRELAPKAERYVASVRYIQPPNPGQLIKKFAYGPTPEAAEIKVLDAVADAH